jgi:hypothetical protein
MTGGWNFADRRALALHGLGSLLLGVEQDGLVVM